MNFQQTGWRAFAHRPLMAVLMALAFGIALAAASGGDRAAAQTGPGTLTVMKVGAPASESFTIEIHLTAQTGDPVGDIVVAGGGQGSESLAAGSYWLSENEEEDYEHEGWALATAGPACPAEPTTSAALFNVDIDAEATTTVCVYNAAIPEPDPGTLSVIKVGPPESASFNIEVHEAGNLQNVITNIVVEGGGQASAQIAPGEYTLSELESQDWVHDGWALAVGGDACPGAPTTTADLVNVTVASNATTTICVYNSDADPDPGIMTVRKIGPPADEFFNIEVHEAGNLANVITNFVVPGGGQASDAIPPGSYTLSEFESQDFILEGWALGGAGGTCPAEPTTSASLFTVSVVSNATTTVCVYNEEDTVTLDGFLRLRKMGGETAATYTFALDGPDAANSVSVQGQSSTSLVGLDVGTYMLTENLAGSAGVLFQGWATVSGDTQCPASPTSTSQSIQFTIAAGATTTVCAYNVTATADDPVVTLVSPNTGHVGGGMAVGIRGTGFTGATSVTFGGTPATWFAVWDDTTIVAATPARPTGTVNVTVTTPQGTSANTAADDFTFSVMMCPDIPLWVNDLEYGSAGEGFYWDPISGLVWTAERSWHVFSPQPPRPAPQPLWVNALTYGSVGGGFYWDPVSGQVWTAQRGWHPYAPTTCIA